MDKVDPFHRKEHFPFRELRLVDGINPRKVSFYFILFFKLNFFPIITSNKHVTLEKAGLIVLFGPKVVFF